ncbi:hypothetical protein Cni_G26171 [Canna indica]|uniref:Uncharacterized protein n=1 Tax=Canna indica TaxID=4628 RepID=A0AAQ3KZ53_9LILI|nr:hypothetical protein Cni_G26171 [Canna indica]
MRRGGGMPERSHQRRMADLRGNVGDEDEGRGSREVDAEVVDPEVGRGEAEIDGGLDATSFTHHCCHLLASLTITSLRVLAFDSPLSPSLKYQAMGLELIVDGELRSLPPPIQTPKRDHTKQAKEVECAATPKSSSEPDAGKLAALVCPPPPRKPRPAKRKLGPPPTGYYPVPSDLASIFIPVSKKIRAALAGPVTPAMALPDAIALCRGAAKRGSGRPSAATPRLSLGFGGLSPGGVEAATPRLSLGFDGLSPPVDGLIFPRNSNRRIWW